LATASGSAENGTPFSANSLPGNSMPYTAQSEAHPPACVLPCLPLLANLGVASRHRCSNAFEAPLTPQSRSSAGSMAFYLDQPEEWDDPYRFFRW
jgi:hypothetical protein